MTKEKQTEQKQLRRMTMEEYDKIPKREKRLNIADVIELDKTKIPEKERMVTFENEVWKLAQKGANAYIPGRTLTDDSVENLEGYGFHFRCSIYCPLNYVFLDGKRYSKWIRKE